jgi:hypothetical protein
MKNSILALGSTLLLFVLSGCAEDRIVYVKVPCPRLIPYEVNTTVRKQFTLDYEVMHGN